MRSVQLCIDKSSRDKVRQFHAMELRLKSRVASSVFCGYILWVIFIVDFLSLLPSLVKSDMMLVGKSN